MKATLILSEPRHGHSDAIQVVCDQDLRSISRELQIYAASRGLLPAEVHMSITYPPAKPFYERFTTCALAR